MYICWRCQGALNIEHAVTERLSSDERITYLYCDWCGIGRETLWERDGIDWVEMHTVEYSRAKDVQKLEQFIARMDASRSCAA